VGLDFVYQELSIGVIFQCK